MSELTEYNERPRYITDLQPKTNQITKAHVCTYGANSDKTNNFPEGQKGAIYEKLFFKSFYKVFHGSIMKNDECAEGRILLVSVHPR